MMNARLTRAAVASREGVVGAGLTCVTKPEMNLPETASLSKLFGLHEPMLIDDSPDHFIGLKNLNLTVNVSRVCNEHSTGRVGRSSTVFKQNGREGRIVPRREHKERNPSAKTGKDPNEAKAPILSNETNDGISVHRIWLFGPSGSSAKL